MLGGTLLLPGIDTKKKGTLQVGWTQFSEKGHWQFDYRVSQGEVVTTAEGRVYHFKA